MRYLLPLLCLFCLTSPAQATSLADLVNGGTLTTSGGLTFSNFTARLDTEAYGVTGLQTTSISTLATIQATALNADSILFGPFEWNGRVTTTGSARPLAMNLFVTYDVTGLGADPVFPYGPRVVAERSSFADGNYHFVTAIAPSGASVHLANFDRGPHPEWHPLDTLPIGTTQVSVRDQILLELGVVCPRGPCLPFGLATQPAYGPIGSGVFTTFETAPLSVSSVPEPATWVLLATGLLITFSMRKMMVLRIN